MKQITSTVEQFLSAIVGVGLICFFSFILLLASAKLNDSLLGTLLADLAGETARTARTESFAYWGTFGQEVADGLGVFQGGGVVVQPTPTAVTIIATQPPNPNPQPTTPPSNQPTATPLPSTFVRDSIPSKVGVLIWQGLDYSTCQNIDDPLTCQYLPGGVNFVTLRSQVDAAFAQNPGDLKAMWLQKRLGQCEPIFTSMGEGLRTRDVTLVYSEADKLLGCNPRAIIAVVAKRWVDIRALATTQPIDSKFPVIWPSDEAQAIRLLDGLSIGIGGKLDGMQRGVQPGDHILVTIFDERNVGLGPINIAITARELDGLVKDWTLDSGPYSIGLTSLVPNPANLPAPNPATPSEADLTPPTVTPASDAPSGAAGGAEITQYTVQSGDTANSIARQFNITLEALIAANPDTLGLNASLIYPGQVLNIP